MLIAAGTVPAMLEWMPASSGGALAPIVSVICAPQSPPWATNRSYPSRAIRSNQASAILIGPQPVDDGFSEYPNPGSDGTTTWNASAASPPCAIGSASGPTTFSISTTEPGQPCVMSSGSAPSCGDLTWMKWMSETIDLSDELG